MTTGCFDKTAVHRNTLHPAIFKKNTGVVFGQHTQKRSVAGQKGNFATALGTCDELGGDT